MKLKVYQLIISIFLISNAGNAQFVKMDSLQRIGVCDEDGFCIPGIDNSIRPKGISIIQERVLDYEIKSSFNDSTANQTGEIRRNREYEINIKFPVLLKENYNLIMGLEYKVEQFAFDDGDERKNAFYTNLNNKPLRKYGYKVYYTRRFKGDNYLYTRGSLSFNGDLDGSNFSDGTFFKFFRSSFSALYGKKVSRSKTWGYGISGGYNFGNYNVYPLLHYNKQWNKKWGVELTLPVKTEFRYIANEKNIFYFTNRLWGDNYILNLDSVSGGRTFLGINSFRSLLTYEREVYDFIWITFSAGLRINNRFDLTEESNFLQNRSPFQSDNPFIRSNTGEAFFIRFGIFIVPPRKMLNKNK